MDNKQIVFDGSSIYNSLKAYTLKDLPEEAWEYITGGKTGTGHMQRLYKAVPWLFRGVSLRANAVSRAPFVIWDGENELDTSIKYENKVGFMPNPTQLVGRIEASLTLLSRSYLFKKQSASRILEVEYKSPISIKPNYSREDGSIIGFKRRVRGQSIDLDLEDVVHFYRLEDDPFIEVGEPQSSPGLAAMAAAGVIFNLDQFARMFFERGAIKAQVLQVPKGTAPDQRDRLGSWFKRAVSGIANAWASVVIQADDMKPITIGEGIKELENVELNKEKREDISTALGVPQTLLFSNAANFATAKQDWMQINDLVVRPETQFIQAVLNEQVFGPLGLRLEFMLEQLQVFQEEEVNRSAALVNLVNADIPTVDAMQILGYDLPVDMDWEQLATSIIAEKERRASMLPQFGRGSGEDEDDEQGPKDPQEDSQLKATLAQWERHAQKRFREGKAIKGTPGAAEFKHDGKIDNALASAIGGALKNVKNVADIKRIFRDARRWDNYP